MKRSSRIFSTAFVPWIVLACGLAITLLLWGVEESRIQEGAQARFTHATSHIESALTRRIQRYNMVVLGCAGLFTVSGEVSRAAWRGYVQSLALGINCPGIEATGFCRRIAAADKEEHIRSLRAEGFPGYDIRPAGDRRDYCPVVYVEPMSGRNAVALGFDAYTETVRRSVLERARDSGSTSLSGKVLLMQEPEQDKQNGVILAAPVYEKNRPHATEADRRAALRGFVYCALRIADYVRGAVGSTPEGLAWELYDGSDTGSEALLYSSGSAPLSAAADAPVYEKKAVVEHFGRTWTLKFRTLPAVGAGLDKMRQKAHAGIGLLVSLLLWAITFLVVSRGKLLADEIAMRKREAEINELHYQQYRTIIDQAGDAIFLHDPDGRILDVNRNACRSLGYSREEMLTLSVKDIDPAAIQKGKDTLWAKTLGGEQFTFESRHMRKDGSTFPIEITVGSVRLPLGIAILGIARDITERRQADEALSRSEERYRTLFEGMSQGAFVQAADGRLIDINPAGLRIFGLTKDEFLNRDSYCPLWQVVREDGALLPPEQHPSMVALLTGQPVHDAVYGLFNPATNTHVWLIANAIPQFLSGEGRPFQVFVTLHDITARRQAETQRDMLSNIVENSLNEVYVFSAQTMRFVHANYGALKNIGYTQDQLKRMTPLDLKPQLTNDDFRELLKPLILGEINMQVFETVHRRADGSLYPVLINLQFFSRNEDSLFLATVQDLTERLRAEGALKQELEKRRRTEAALQKAENILAEAQTIAHMGAWSYDPETNEFRWADEIYRIFGLPVGKPLRYLDLMEYAHPDDYQTLVQGWSKLNMEEAETDNQYRIIRPDGGMRYLHEYTVYQYHNGSFAGCAGLIFDITERKAAEEALVKSELAVRSTLDGLSAHIAQLDDRGAILLVNKAWVDFAVHNGLSPEAVGEGANYLKVCDEASGADSQGAAAFAEGIRSVLSGKAASFVMEYQCHAPLKQRWFIGRVTLFPGGGSPRVIVAHEDITEHKLAEKALQAKNDELERFTYTISHDLKSPLVTIRTFLGLLGQDIANNDSQSVAQDMEFINGASKKMNAMLDELLQLSRIGRVMQPSVATPLQDLVQETLSLVAGRIQQRGVRVQVTGESIMLFGDHMRLMQVFQNLVDNAVKFMGDQPAPLIEIGAEAADGGTVVFVRDNGIGIDPKFREKLFGLFEKLDPNAEGTGMGLALVKRIVDVHGGRIWAESEGVGKGACFYFTLPGKSSE